MGSPGRWDTLNYEFIKTVVRHDRNVENLDTPVAYILLHSQQEEARLKAGGNSSDEMPSLKADFDRPHFTNMCSFS
jgi:hypothetical protein